MSNFLAIATVTAALRQTLQASIGVDLSGATVTTQRPDTPGSGTQEAHVNLYLYQIAHNAAWRNADLPTHRADGELVQRPQVALNLHYLLSFYGNESQLEPQRLLGSAVRTLHARPVLTRQMIRDTIANPTFNFLANSNLADEVELVKFTPISLSTEELSKLWSVFFQTPYTLSIAYEGDVVLIESEDTPHRALPVRERNLYVVPFRQPVIEQIVSQDQVIIAGSTLIILGKNLRGDIMRVRVGDVEVPLAPQDVSDTQISLSVPSSLYAGIQGVQMIHDMPMGTPPVQHRGVESNVAAFVLHPMIAASVSNVQGSGSALRSADLTVQVNPTVGKVQRLILLLNEVSSGVPASYTFVAAPRAADTNSITIPIKGMKAAEYLVRVQVDGAESPLIVDTNSNSPTFNQYISPKVTIP